MNTGQIGAQEESVRTTTTSITSPDVIAFPGAGSFGGELRTVIGEFGASAWLAQYPGRFGRDFGKAAPSFTALVDHCLAQIDRRRPSRPLLVGHSFGAYVAYAVAARLPERGTEVVALVAVGANAPSLASVPESAMRSRADLIDYLADLAPDAEVSDEWREATLDLAVQDLRLLREFVSAEHPRLRCPIHAARGDRDPLASTDGISQWRTATSGEFTHRVFAGDHSNVLHGSEFISWLREVSVGAAAGVPE